MVELRSPQVQWTYQIEQGVHADITEDAHDQGALCEFEVSEAECSKWGGIQSRISPIDPKCTVRRVFDAIEPDIFLQEGIHSVP